MGDCRRRRTRRGLNGDRGEEEEEESAGGFRAPRVRNFKLRSPRGVAPTLVHRRRKKIEDGEVDRGNGGEGKRGERPVWLEIDPEDAHRQVLRAGHHRTRGLRELLICSP